MTGLEFVVDDRGVATIRLNRPEEGNALDLGVAEGLAAAIEAIRQDASVRVVRLSSAGRIFCGGGDVGAMAASPDRGAYLADLAGTVHRSLIALDGLAVPVVAAVQGPAAGAGLGLMLAADIVVASPKSSFVAAYSGVGLSPDCGVSINLPRAIGLRRALRMLVRNERVDARTALEWGLIDDLAEPDELDRAADDVVALLLERPTEAVGQARRLARASYARTFADHLDDEASTISEIGRGGAAAELIARFA
ncbi:enoyl-CoA hydratase/isomerase family protein [Gordonia sp. 'Campus']|uniref:enoyl-CoA hydratase/isomerase family protein n=1 Tax=Gordonia sp. 'Campus' TaxID=2915824 RepID=UPI001EE400BB|nr:enoyl-CoA hydratase/isomerase family protein [Gordonia sp. 'Campus']